MFYMKSFLASGALLLCALQVQAIPVELVHTTTVSSSDISGVAIGDTVTLTLFAENGGDSVNSQTWRIGDIISGSLKAGSYWQSYIDGWFSGSTPISFVTDVSGALTTADFFGTTFSANHQDPLGVGPRVNLYNSDFQDFLGNQASFNLFLQNPSAWTVAKSVQVPEPSTILLLVIGVIAIGFSRRCDST